MSKDSELLQPQVEQSELPVKINANGFSVQIRSYHAELKLVKVQA